MKPEIAADYLDVLYARNETKDPTGVFRKAVLMAKQALYKQAAVISTYEEDGCADGYPDGKGRELSEHL